MEPQSPLSSPSPEMEAGHAPEAKPTPQNNEVFQARPEQSQQSGGPETHNAATSSGAPAPAAVTPLPQMATLPAPQPTQKTVQQPTQTGSPLAASDDDVIEKEWVDKAKKIVEQTKDDPYAQEKEVSKLQADYIKKRYGKEIKLSSE